MSDRTHIVSWEDPAIGLARVRDLSGLEFLQAMIRGEIPPPPIAQLLGFRLAKVEPGSAVFECVPGEHHYNPIGVVHGGLGATMLDSAMACAIHSTLPAGVAYTTLEIKVSFLRAVTLETGLVRARGTLLNAGKTVGFAEGRLEDAQGKLLAHGTTTCIVRGR